MRTLEDLVGLYDADAAATRAGTADLRRVVTTRAAELWIDDEGESIASGAPVDTDEARPGGRP